MTNINKLFLSNFRNFEYFELEASKNLINLIIGPNGAGKTSILEAVSMLAPGKGLRNSGFDQILKHNQSTWQIKTSLSNHLGNLNLLIDYEKNRSGRFVYLDERKISSTELTTLCSIIFLTPQMNNLFSSMSERRKLLDRLVYHFDTDHSSRTHRYEYYLKERMKLLELGSHNPSWLDIIEEKISDAAISIGVARNKILNLLNKSISNISNSFPKAKLEIDGYIEKTLESDMTSLPENIRRILKDNRSEDYVSKKTNFGTHRSDFIVKFEEKDMRAELCSTGEQKAILVSIILAKTIATIEFYNMAPIILLDEIMTHLDTFRRDELLQFLTDLKCQIWITATEEEYFREHKTNIISL